MLLAVLCGAASAPAAEGPDLLLADFEGDTYGEGWKTTGTAFGAGPARGTLPNQMHVEGYLGKGLVNSFKGGDASTGTLTSPEFKVERKYVNFLVGGGKHPGTRIDLIVDGKAVRSATGPNDRPGGSERLDWHTWDVAEFEGKAARIRIVDEEKGGWGHVNVDQVVQSDARKQAEPLSRAFTIDKRYLLLPVKNGAPMRRVTFTVDKQVAREFDIELAEGAPDFWVFADVSAFKGKTLDAKALLPGGSKALDALKLSDDVPDADKLYKERHRPLFHFTSRVGWLNDPNGLVYLPPVADPKSGAFAAFSPGEWHLFYQHNPFGREWGNMHWGHAVSPDLLHWKEEGIALYPKKYGDWAFSGSAVFDKENTSGFGTKEKPPLVLAYTSTGRGECIAYSNDRGKSWKEYDKNPVVKHAGRDPRLVWYGKGKHWVMAVYDEDRRGARGEPGGGTTPEADKKQWIAFYTSPDLKTWTFASRIEGFYECPDLFELPLTNVQLQGGPPDTKWVLHAADGKYVTGDFDGKTFKPDSKDKKQLWHGNFYAAQTFSNAPLPPPFFGSGMPAVQWPRRVQIGWARGVTFPGTPFNQQMTVPVTLRLSTASGEPKLFAQPIDLGTLREKEPAFETKGGGSLFARDGRNGELRFPLANKLDAFELWAEIDVGTAASVGFDLRGTKLLYDPRKQTLTCKGVTAPVTMTNPINERLTKRLRLRVLVDRGSVEVFADGGLVAMSVAAIPDEKNDKLAIVWSGGDVTVNRMYVYRIKSAWGK
jgi:fructan beta-fructosidase